MAGFEPIERLKGILGATPREPWSALIPQILRWCFRRFCIQNIISSEGALRDSLWESHFELIERYCPKGLEVASMEWLTPENIGAMESSLDEYNRFFVEFVDVLDKTIVDDNYALQDELSEFLDTTISRVIFEWLGDSPFVIFPVDVADDDICTDTRLMKLVDALVKYTPVSVPAVAEPEPEPQAAAAEPEPKPQAAAAEPETESEAATLEPEPQPEPEAAVLEPEPQPQPEPEPMTIPIEEPVHVLEPEPEAAALEPEHVYLSEPIVVPTREPPAPPVLPPPPSLLWHYLSLPRNIPRRTPLALRTPLPPPIVPTFPTPPPSVARALAYRRTIRRSGRRAIGSRVKTRRSHP